MRTKSFDILQLRRGDLLERIRGIDMPGFAGVASALYAGEQFAAVHLGIRSRTVLHYGIPAFNRSLQKYSPGSLILWKIARAAAEIAIDLIDPAHPDTVIIDLAASRQLTAGTRVRVELLNLQRGVTPSACRPGIDAGALSRSCGRSRSRHSPRATSTRSLPAPD